MLALTSGEMKRWLMANYSCGVHEPAGIQTTCIAAHPEAKTDRSALRRVSYEKQPDGRFKIVYVGDFRPDTFSAVLKGWLKKFGDKQRVKEKNGGKAS
jgi:hypothetical protein